MSNTLDKVLKVAYDEIGYCEKASIAMPALYDKYTNQGDKNYTKYAQDLFPNLQGQPWCAMFTCWIFTKAYTILEAKKLLCGEFSAYTPTFAQHFKDKGQWFTSPKQGDVIFFKNSQRICHVGIVYTVIGDSVQTIEGNTSASKGVVSNGGMVCVKKYTVGDSYIAGYGRPKYDTQSSTIQVINTTTTTTQTLSANTYKGIDVSAYNPIANYNLVKQAGVRFAIVKAIRKDGEEDKLFGTHINGFKSVGIPIYGVYNYSYATTTEKAKEDALKVVQVLKKYGLNCTVYLDVEDNCQKNLGSKLIEIINTYHAIIQNSGYKFGLYTGMSFYNSFIKPYKQYLACQNEWIARYPSESTMNFSDMPDSSKKPNIGTTIEGWQYSSKCKVNGINGLVDVNIMYDNTSGSTAYKNKTGVVSDCNKLNFRKEPLKEDNVIDVLLCGQQVTILDALDDWYKVQYGNQVGYCSSNYIKVL